MYKKYISLLTIFTFISTISTGCYREIDINHLKDNKEKDLLTINSILSPDSAISVSATYPWFYSDGVSSKKIARDLSFTLKINGELQPSPKWDESKNLYVSDAKPQSDDIVELSTVNDGKNIYALDKVPQKVDIDNLSVNVYGPYEKYGHKEYKITYALDFTDPSNDRNYYFLKLEFPNHDEDNDGMGFGGSIDMSQNIVFRNLEIELGLNQGKELYSKFGLPFSDKGIDGKKHSITMVETFTTGSNLNELVRRVKLYSISEPYYRFLVDAIKYEAIEDHDSFGIINLGITDPIRIYSNIENGTGLLGSYTMSKKVIRFTID